MGREKIQVILASIGYIIVGFVFCYLVYTKTVAKGQLVFAFLAVIIAYVLGLSVALFTLIFTFKLGK